MLLCFSSLCSCDGYNYQKKKKQKLKEKLKQTEIEKAAGIGMKSTKSNNNSPLKAGGGGAAAPSEGVDSTGGRERGATACDRCGGDVCSSMGCCRNVHSHEGLTVGCEQWALLEQMASVVLLSYKQCNIPFLLPAQTVRPFS